MFQEKKILTLASSLAKAQDDLGSWPIMLESVQVFESLPDILSTAFAENSGIYITATEVKRLFEPTQARRDTEVLVLDVLPFGIASLDLEQNIVWSNRQFRVLCGGSDENFTVEHPAEAEGQSFYQNFGNPDILGPDFCPFNTVKATLQPTKTVLRSAGNEFYQMGVTPLLDKDGQLWRLIVSLQDISDSQITEQRLDALMKAGAELSDLTPDQLKDLSPEDRISLLTSNIIQYTMDLLDYDVVEIRLLSSETGELELLLASGMDEEATHRNLYPQPEGNGITGYVAYSGKSYLCEETAEDPYYLQGMSGAKSSLTVPLLYHDQVVGTFNVESPESRAFTEKDLRFLELFAVHVASAINTLELLSMEKAETAAASVEAIHAAVALPIDMILNDAVIVLSQHNDLEPELIERLKHIQAKAREIKAVIQQIGERMTPTPASLNPPEDKHPLLRNSNVLVVDKDESVLLAANEMLARFGCNVESAPLASEALLMVKNANYDAIIADIRMQDCNGYQFLLKLRDVMTLNPIPLILMTGFGYDPGHVVVNARKEGVDTFLYKPFRLDRLIFNLETVIGRNR